MRAAPAPTSLFAGLTLSGLAFFLLAQPYSAPSPWARYDAPAHRYLSAAAREDTVELRALSAADQPVTWALRTHETQRRALLAWVNSSRAYWAFTRGDTAEVWYESGTRACPFSLTFVGAQHPRLLAAHARCYIHRGWPSDSVIAIRR